MEWLVKIDGGRNALQALPGGFNLATMAEFDLKRNRQNEGYGLDFIHTVTPGSISDCLVGLAISPYLRFIRFLRR